MVFTNSLIKNGPFIEAIINGMYDWVRVIDKNDNVIFMNKAMEAAIGKPLTGTKCYEIVGRDSPCDNCTTRKTVFDGKPHEKEEFINHRVFSVMCSPLRNTEGEIVAVVEVLRETTQIKQLYREMQEQNEKHKWELSMARRLQSSLLPRLINNNKIDFSYLYIPCETLGGDFIDIFMIDESHLGLYIADVSGHGVPASLLTVFLRSSINKKHLSPAKALEELYFEFNKGRIDDELYITIFYCIIDLGNGTMLYSNAGLNVAPIIFGKERFELLRHPGIPISNWTDKPGYRDGFIKLKDNDMFFIYTDGILEIKDKNNNQYGEDRMLGILLNNSLSPKRKLLDLKKSAFQFAGINSASELHDDITMALLEFK